MTEMRFTPVPMNALDRIPRELIEELSEAASGVIRSGWYVLGPQVAQFESQFAAYCGTRHALGVANGTDALELALRAAGCGTGDLVATVANAGMYSATAIVSAGAKPIWIDVDAASMTMDPTSLLERWNPRIKAIIVTHLYGQLADVEAIAVIARNKGVFLIEDCAQAHGASRGGVKAGAFGDLAAFSFYPTKNLGTLGDGGAITTSDDALAQRVKSLRQYGWSSRYNAQLPGGRNSRLDEVHAAMLCISLPYLDEWNARRQEISARIARSAAKKGVIFIGDIEGPANVCHLLVARTKERDRVRATLQNAGIATDVHYPIPDHKQGAFARSPEANVSLPVTEALANEIFSLPCFPWLTEEEITRMEHAVEIL